jgi:hypothetical protein
MSARLGAVALLLFLGVAACAGGRGAESRAPDPEARLLEGRAFAPEGRRDIFVSRGFRVAARTGPELRTQLGVPDETESRPIQNLHDPAVTDSILTWRYDGLEVEIYRTADGRRLLARALVTANRFLTFPEVGIGAREAELRRILGAPDAESAGELEYRCAFCSGPVEPALVHLAGGAVTRIEFLFAVD